MNWFDQANSMFKFWAEGQKSAFQALAEESQTSASTGDRAAAQGAGTSGAEGIRHINEMWKSSMESWAVLAQQVLRETAAGGGISEATLRKLFDPANWAKAGAGEFDLGIERLTEGPSYATLWDLDRKILEAQKLWRQRQKDVAAYRVVVQKAWNQAFARFAKDLGNPERAPIKSWRELVDVWIEIANDTLLEMHRSEDFLEAQRRMTRSAMDYRLQEREIAEAFCELHHIPTRTEVDELQRIACELRRELRVLQRAQGTAANKAKPRTASAKKRAAGSAKAVPSSVKH